MSNIVIGTAGHIDHGKTTLIGALTGIETDKTKEEKTRGMSINLGFAYFDLPSGKRVGIIDVPGHEKFIKNMLAGVQGINMIMLVVDACEGIMPQTVEHANILNLLGIKDYIVVITKCDLVDDEMVELVREDIKDNFEATPIMDAPVVLVDSVSRRGFDDLVKTIEQVASKIKGRSANLEPRLNVDRVFTVKGFGTVVTGTLVEGKIKVGDELTLYTKEIPVKLRNIQVHDENVKEANMGQRTALNLIGVKQEEVERGDVLTKKGNVQKSYIVDAKISVLKNYGRPLELWDRVRVYIGTREVMARVVPLGTECVEPGSEGFVQLRLEEEIVSKPGDKLILRNYSPMVTLGGGSVLEPNSKKHNRFDDNIIKQLEVREKNDVGEVISTLLETREETLFETKEIIEITGFDKDICTEKLSELEKEGLLVKIAKSYVGKYKLESVLGEFIRIIKDYHRKNQLKAGISKEELKTKMKYTLKAKEYEPIFNYLVGRGAFKNVDGLVSLEDFEVKYTAEQQKIFDEVDNALREDGFSPRNIEEFGNDEDTTKVIASMIGKSIIRLDGDISIHATSLEKAYKILEDYITANGEIGLAQYRDMLDTSRKYAVAILDYFDKLGITKRLGDARVITGKKLTLK